MKRAVIALAGLLLAGCGDASGIRVEGPAPSPPKQIGPVYVNAYLGHPLQRPKGFALTEFTSIGKLRWNSWGGETAVGVGQISGSWCIPGCQERGIPATITLSQITWRERVGYYSRFTLDAPSLPKDADPDLQNSALFVPES
ncbi:hypothetical protein [Rhizohabitans arisaemae]|uniref:hypothetical protein n=1 Tax=Rhizohabitans arisaemae TaxID=2720610 RepID=UPI0024B063AA|nr:hypothetical protein [Rhizohabitans arisaemae]